MSQSEWIRPWNVVKFDDLYNRDERFFSVVMKGLIGWLTNNIVLYNKPIKHFIQNTGSSYMYVETNGYFYSWNETSGEDYMYMQMPRCLIEFAGITIPTEELTSAYQRGSYERRDGDVIRGFNAQIRRIPLEIDINLKYVLSNFNESIILAEEIISKIVFQRYFKIAFLGQIITCSIEIPTNFNIEINRIDMTEATTNQKNIQLSVKVCTNYPSIDEITEIPTDKVIASFITGKTFEQWSLEHAAIFKEEESGNTVKVHINDKGDYVDEDNNPVNLSHLVNEFGEHITEHDVLQAINKDMILPTHSTLFFDDISNTVDIISKKNILK